MKILIVQTASAKIQKIARRLKEKLQDCDKNITVELWEESRRQIACADIRQAQADLFITFNLAGFEPCTLTGGVAFNLLDCKQIHFLLDAKLENEKYLARLLSISMFFYCADEAFYHLLMEKYPDLPYLKEMDGWEREGGEEGLEKNAETLCRAVREVAALCHLA